MSGPIYRRLQSLRANSWPKPEASIGEWFCRMRLQNCWEAVGPAATAWEELCQDIQAYLEQHVDAVSNGVIWSCYMVGRTKDTAQPTVFFCSVDAESRQRVRATISTSGLLERYPGFRTADRSRLPDMDKIIPLGLQQPQATFT